jgi:hypothetical protein
MKNIVVTGDLVWDHHLVHDPSVQGFYHEPVCRTVMSKTAGGAWYLKELLGLSCSDFDSRELKILSPARCDAPDRYHVSQAYMIWAPHQRKVGSKDKKDKSLRITQFLGCQAAVTNTKMPPFDDDVPDPDLLVLDDLGTSFYDKRELWPKALGKDGDPKRIILKTSRPLDNPLINMLVKNFADRLTVVLSASTLRTCGAEIALSLSWDLAVEQIIQVFSGKQFADNLARCRRVIVHFDCEGAASFTRCGLMFGRQTDADKIIADRVRFERFIYHPRKLEGMWKAQMPGLVFGTKSLITAALARHEIQSSDHPYPLFIALARALEASRLSYKEGGGQEAKFFSFNGADDAIRKAFQPKAEDENQSAQYATAFPRHFLTGRGDDSSQAMHSDILQDFTGTGTEYVVAKAMDVVIRGVDEAIRGIPQARYGNYVTVDREEIERINSIRGLIMSYRGNPADPKPLSLAVFGPPGAGKSFAIKQLASELFGQKKTIQEFNLSQFRTIEDLHRAFHIVRDASVRGQIPLVFWDEFDTSPEGRHLFWLKEFLAPMQDAEFRIGETVHPFGKAIFVFAGGTSPDFDSFNRSEISGPEGDLFRRVKGPDFVSRLRGYVNIKGPNPVTGSRANDEKDLDQDPAHLIRRAILLRSIIGRDHHGLIRDGLVMISPGVIRGFLIVKGYLHGARSLEAVVNMSSLNNTSYFGAAELPLSDLLKLHATPDFLEHVRQGDLDRPVVEVLAEACHEAWRRQKVKDGWYYAEIRCDETKKHPLLLPYGSLQEPAKEGNRFTARLTRAKLSQLGYRIERRIDDRTQPKIHEFSEKETEDLAKIEHDIWLRDHLLKGYEWSEKTVERLFLHRDIAAFDDVPDEDKELDGEITKSIPGALSRCHYTLVKVSQ